MKKIVSLFMALIACISLCGCMVQTPSAQVNCTHSWNSANCLSPSVCAMCGQLSGVALGHSYTKGMCIRCNAKDPDYREPDHIAYGTVSGTITYKYNDFVGNCGDTGALVLLISKNVKKLPDRLGLGMTSENPEGVYDVKVDGNGNYSFNHIPAGEYIIVVLSKNTNEDPDRVAGYRTWGDAYGLFSEKGQSNALLTAKTRKIRSDKITVHGDETTNYSYDFGITYI